MSKDNSEEGANDYEYENKGIDIDCIDGRSDLRARTACDTAAVQPGADLADDGRCVSGCICGWHVTGNNCYVLISSAWSCWASGIFRMQSVR